MPKSPDRNRKRGKSPAATLEKRIRACFETLPNSERQIAELLLNFPSHLATHSATELASLSGASKAAVTRLIQRLGYAGFAEARAEVRSARQWGSPLYLDDERHADESQRQEAIEVHMAADIEILRKTLEGLEPQVLEEVVASLHRSRRVVVIGHRNSALLAAYCRGQLGVLRGNVELAPMPGETLAEGLYGLSDQDVLLAVGFRRRVPAFISALDVARRAGARIVLLTDPGGAAISRRADWTITCHCRGASIFDSYVAAVSVINFLANQLSARSGASARERLRGIESLHESLGDLV
jgi:DNA-binding MurR/RpiR family transcriptional regulator